MSTERVNELLQKLSSFDSVANAKIVLLRMPSLRKTHPHQEWYGVSYDYHPKHYEEPQKRIDVVGKLPEQYHKKHRVCGNWESRFEYRIGDSTYYVGCYIAEPIDERYRPYHPGGENFSLMMRPTGLKPWRPEKTAVECQLVDM